MENRPKEYYFSPEYLLSEATKHKCMENVLKVGSVDLFSEECEQKAAVLIGLCNDRGTMSLIYTLRSAKLKSFGGHVSFPGGKADSTDLNIEETALRETEEELGLSRSSVEIWGVGNYFTTLTKLAVYPVIGYVKNFNFADLTPNSDEVEAAFALPLEHLCDARNIQVSKQMNGRYLVPSYHGGLAKIWGITAFLTHLFLLSVFPPEVYDHDLTNYPVSKL